GASFRSCSLYPFLLCGPLSPSPPAPSPLGERVGVRAPHSRKGSPAGLPFREATAVASGPGRGASARWAGDQPLRAFLTGPLFWASLLCNERDHLVVDLHRVFSPNFEVAAKVHVALVVAVDHRAGDVLVRRRHGVGDGHRERRPVAFHLDALEGGTTARETGHHPQSVLHRERLPEDHLDLLDRCGRLDAAVVADALATTSLAAAVLAAA